MTEDLLREIVNLAVQVGRLEEQHEAVCSDLDEASNDLMHLVGAALNAPTTVN